VGASAEAIRHRPLVVYFDSRGVAESVSCTDQVCPGYMVGAAGTRIESAPCIDVATADSLVDGLATEQVVLNLEPGERLRERFLGAAYRSGEQWIAGMVLVTNRSMLLLCWPDPSAGRLLPPRLTGSQIVQVAPAPEDPLKGGPTALLVLIDGSHGSVPDGAAQQTGAFDQVRAERFIESGRLLQAPQR
jgi:hypothetical protein